MDKFIRRKGGLEEFKVKNNLTISVWTSADLKFSEKFFIPEVLG